MRKRMMATTTMVDKKMHGRSGTFAIAHGKEKALETKKPGKVI